MYTLALWLSKHILCCSLELVLNPLKSHYTASAYASIENESLHILYVSARYASDRNHYLCTHCHTLTHTHTDSHTHTHTHTHTATHAGTDLINFSIKLFCPRACLEGRTGGLSAQRVRSQGCVLSTSQGPSGRQQAQGKKKTTIDSICQQAKVYFGKFLLSFLLPLRTFREYTLSSCPVSRLNLRHRCPLKPNSSCVAGTWHHRPPR